jgi:hypothetical protein
MFDLQFSTAKLRIISYFTHIFSQKMINFAAKRARGHPQAKDQKE